MTLLQQYLAFFGMPRTLCALGLGSGIAVGFFVWLRTTHGNRRRIRPLVVFAGACCIPFLSILCLQYPIPSWWERASIVLAFPIAILIRKYVDLGRGRGGVFVFLLLVVVIVTALDWLGEVIGESVLFPALKYVFGYGIPIVMPFALVALFITTMVQLRRNLSGVWALLLFGCFLCVVGFVIVEPLLEDGIKMLVRDTLFAVLPCVGALALFDVRRDIPSGLLGVVVLHLLVAGLLLSAVSVRRGAPSSPVFSALLSLPAALGACAVFLGLAAIGVSRVFRQGFFVTEVPRWVVVMPWVTLVPAFYAATLGIKWLVAFVISNLVIGLIFVGLVVGACKHKRPSLQTSAFAGHNHGR